MSRGVYRGVYSSLFDDPDYQQLTPHARLTLLTLRQCGQAGAAAIFRYYPAVLVEQTGLDAAQLEAALQELERPAPRSPWIHREGVVVWVRNGLRHDPHMRLGDEKHVKGILRAVESLPRAPIVLRFCDYYGIARPFDAPPQALGRPIPSEYEYEKDPEAEKEKDPEVSLPRSHSSNGATAEAWKHERAGKVAL